MYRAEPAHGLDYASWNRGYGVEKTDGDGRFEIAAVPPAHRESCLPVPRRMPLAWAMGQKVTRIRSRCPPLPGRLAISTLRIRAHRGLQSLRIRVTAAFSPLWSSEITSYTPRRPRRTSERSNSVQRRPPRTPTPPPGTRPSGARRRRPRPKCSAICGGSTISRPAGSVGRPHPWCRVAALPSGPAVDLAAVLSFPGHNGDLFALTAADRRHWLYQFGPLRHLALEHGLYPSSDCQQATVAKCLPNEHEAYGRAARFMTRD